jgi:hypothetical protein
MTHLVIESGQIVPVIEIYDARHGELLLSSDPSNAGDARMKIVDGSVTTDTTRAVVGTADARIVVDEETAGAVVPLVQDAGLSPTAPARVHVKFKAPGSSQHSDYGVYELDTLSIDETEAGILLNAEVSDNSRRVERARFFRPRTIANRTPYADAFLNLLESVLPESEITIAQTKAKTGVLSFDIQDDRLAAVNSMATAIGYRIDWNHEGRGNTDISPDTDSDSEPMWEFIDGGNARITAATRVLTDERSYNGVIAMGEAAGSDTPPVRAEWWDTNPESPTYFDPTQPQESTYGPVPFFYVSEFITTKTQALNAAKSRLPKVLGLVEELTIKAVRHPGIVPGDPIFVSRPSIGVNGIYIVQSVNLPLLGSGGRMTIVCRERRVFI